MVMRVPRENWPPRIASSAAADGFLTELGGQFSGVIPFDAVVLRRFLEGQRNDLVPIVRRIHVDLLKAPADRREERVDLGPGSAE